LVLARFRIRMRKRADTARTALGWEIKDASIEASSRGLLTQ